MTAKRAPIREKPSAHKAAIVRENGKLGGRPAGKMNAEKIAFRDRIRAREEQIVDRMFHVAFNGKSEAVQCAALRDLFDRGWGRPAQPHDGDGEGGPITFNVSTRVRLYGDD